MPHRKITLVDAWEIPADYSSATPVPVWLFDLMSQGLVEHLGRGSFRIRSAWGVHTAGHGEVILRNHANNECWPVKVEYFRQNYEAV